MEANIKKVDTGTLNTHTSPVKLQTVSAVTVPVSSVVMSEECKEPAATNLRAGQGSAANKRQTSIGTEVNKNTTSTTAALGQAKPSMSQPPHKHIVASTNSTTSKVINHRGTSEAQTGNTAAKEKQSLQDSVASKQ